MSLVDVSCRRRIAILRLHADSNPVRAAKITAQYCSHCTTKAADDV